MIRIAILVLVIHLANSQLNYEGNPFTEYTEYIAQESNLSERSARNNDASINLTNFEISSRPQKLYPIMEPESDKGLQQVAQSSNLISDKSRISQGQTSAQIYRSDAEDSSIQQIQVSSSGQNSPISPAEIALNTFMNSRTPEESRMSLDHYLRSQQQSSDNRSRSSDTIVGQNAKSIEKFNTQRQSVAQIEPLLVAPQVDQQVQLTSQVNQGQLMQQLVPQMLPHVGQAYSYAPQSTAVQPVIRTPSGFVLGQGTLPGFQARNDIMTPMMWRERMRRIHGKPFPFAQSRIAPGLYKGPIAVPFKSKGPVEVIYTKPPGFHRGPAIVSNPPVPYENTNAWFPDADHRPSNKDIYYSQLYAQSYDPHYYNYIAATGKIRPHLYGKLDKHLEKQDEGIWSELYRGFKKHGLKNIMTPTFLLGMTLPVVTLMLSALVQKRSIARSDGGRDLDQEEALQEYLERLQRAMECYGRSSRDGKLEGC